MAGERLTGRDGGGPEIVELGSVPGFVVFDLPGAPLSAGGTRLAPDVSVACVAGGESRPARRSHPRSEGEQPDTGRRNVFSLR